ncbi:MAG: long-chain fatty acid--CoA ligase [Frankiales bacterium]|nr:MAG: long-chain fatty acid--CoA ligase [Frankiales bacterium]
MPDLLSATAAGLPDRVAVRTSDESLTYGELWDAARRYAAVLTERGVRPGDRVGVLVPNVPQFPAVYYGVLCAGAVVVPVQAMLRAEEIGYLLADSGARLLIAAAPLLAQGAAGARSAGADVLTLLADADGVDRLDLLAATAVPGDPVARRGEDLAVVIYTSGTTGEPKGAMLTHANVVSNVVATDDALLHGAPDDVVLCCLPLFHAFGQQASMNTTVLTGGTLVLMPRFDADEALRLLVAERVTVFAGVPTMYVGLLAAAARTDLRPSSLRLAISGGAALPLAVLERFRDVFGADVCEGYGLSETTCVATVNQPARGTRPGTVGHPIPGVDVAVAEPDVEDRVVLLGPEQLGEVVIRGSNVMAGYLGRPEATAAAVVDGWFRSGDLGVLDADGFLRIVDRKKDLVIRGGFNVYPREVEEVLLHHDGVQQVAVVGVPDDLYGEEVVAVVVPAPGGALDPAALVAWSRERLGAHKYPRQVRVVDALPLGPSGKVLKRELRDALR